MTLDSAVEAKKNRIVDRLDGYLADAYNVLDRDPDTLTNVDMRKVMESAQAILERASVWIALNNNEVV